MVTFNGDRFVDRCDVFGDKASGDIWWAVMSLTLWIALNARKTSEIALAYVDDNFGADFADNLELYEPYNQLMPRSQVRMLRLWDELRIPHERDEQLCGPAIDIIGFNVDASLPKRPGGSGVRRPEEQGVADVAELAATSWSSKLGTECVPFPPTCPLFE